MKTVAFFNNKGGVGKTSLVYHLAWMLSELNYRVVTADFDPQANLSGMFLNEGRLEQLWEEANRKTVDGDIAPLFKGTGDIVAEPHIEKIGERIGLLVGNLALSNREGELSERWSECLDGEERAFRVTTAFARLVDGANETFKADLALIDVGPNLGAINRAALIACDYVIIPLAPDLFSLHGLGNVGPTLRDWRKAWKKRIDEKPEDLDINLPSGAMQPLGYIVMRHSVRLDRPVQAFQRWIKKIPAEYRRAVLKQEEPVTPPLESDEHLLAQLKDYRSLMPLAQEANKPMFLLKPADGAFGAHMKAVGDCYSDFRFLAQKIMYRVDQAEGKRGRPPIHPRAIRPQAEW